MSIQIQKSHFEVMGLCCSSEIPLIERILKPLEGVKEISVVIASRTVIVVHDNLIISQLQIVNALNKARLEASVRVRGQATYKKMPSPYAIASGVFFVLSCVKFLYDPFKWMGIVTVASGALPILMKAYTSLRNRHMDTNVLVVFAVTGSIVLQDFWEAGLIVFLSAVAQWLQSSISHKATAVMSSLIDMIPHKAILVETGEEVDASVVTLNTLLAVKPGENIPIDGIVVDGTCEVDEKFLTGESFPIFKQINSNVFAGTTNLNGYINIRTTAVAEECTMAKMANLVEEALNNKSEAQVLIEKLVKFYTPVIVILSICFAAIPAMLKVENQRHWIHIALVVLVSGCPCALLLSYPVPTSFAHTKACKSGLFIKGGEYLEMLSKIKVIGFDKTGTITKGEFVITDFDVMACGLSLNTLLYWVSCIESKSSHPMAAALIDYAQSFYIEPKPENVEEFKNFPGEGIYGKIDGKVIFIGNRRIALRARSEAGPSRPSCQRGSNLGPSADEGKPIGYIFLGGFCAATFSLLDTCRSGAKEAINELKRMGIKTAMLTGDSNEAATIIQNQLDGAFEIVHAELLPQDKANLITNFQQEAPTAMVGDGLNDAPALAKADIGISMGVSGSALATKTSNVILTSNDLRKIPEAIKLAKRTKTKVIQNIVISFLAKASIIGLAIAGYAPVWVAVIADVMTFVVVILNSVLLFKETKRHSNHEPSNDPLRLMDSSQRANREKHDHNEEVAHCCTNDHEFVHDYV